MSRALAARPLTELRAAAAVKSRVHARARPPAHTCPRFFCTIFAIIGVSTATFFAALFVRDAAAHPPSLREEAQTAPQPDEGELVRAIVDAARSNATHVIPRVVRDALERLSIPEFVDVALESPYITVELPKGCGRNASVLAFGGTSDFWIGSENGGWEPATFKVLTAVLTARPGVVFDFGAWIGPTLIASANLPSTRVFGMEVDPVAFTQLALNVAANAHIAEKTQVFFVGISESVSERVIVMNTCAEGIGDSCSSMHTAGGRDDLLKLPVQTVPLPAFVAAVGVRAEDISLIKVDAEGAEIFILPTLVPWLRAWPGGVPKPSFWLSLHRFAVAIPWFDRVTPFMKLFKYGYIEKGHGLELAWSSLDTAAGPRKECAVVCTYLLSDFPVSV
jgi:FkbM family methyltransferase